MDGGARGEYTAGSGTRTVQVDQFADQFGLYARLRRSSWERRKRIGTHRERIRNEELAARFAALPIQ